MFHIDVSLTNFSAVVVPLHRRIAYCIEDLYEDEHGVDISAKRRTFHKGDNLTQLDLAMQDVCDGVLSVRRAAAMYGIPKSTLIT